MAQYLAIHNLLLTVPATVTGTVRVLEGLHWSERAVEDEAVAPGTFVLSGATVEADYSATTARRLLKLGALAKPDATLHLDLERVLGDDLATVLRENNLWTLEDIAAEKPATLPGSERDKDGNLNDQSMTIPLRALLMRLADEPSQVDQWIAAAKAALENQED